MHQVPKVNDVVPKFDSKILISHYAEYRVLGPFGSVPGVWVLGNRTKNLIFALKKRYILDLCVSSLRRGHANLLCIVPILADDLRRGSKEWVSPSVKPLGLEKYDPIGGFCCRKVFFLLDFAQKPRFRSDFQLQLYDFDSFWYSRPFRL